MMGANDGHAIGAGTHGTHGAEGYSHFDGLILASAVIMALII